MSSVQWFSNQYMQLRFPVRNVIINNVFNYQTISLAVAAPEDEKLIPADDLNEHVWKNPAGFEDVYDRFADQLTVENTFF